jgi:hypothetical protein
MKLLKLAHWYTQFNPTKLIIVIKAETGFVYFEGWYLYMFYIKIYKRLYSKAGAGD